MAKTKRRLSEAEPAERRRRDRERLYAAAERLQASEGWRRWVCVRSRAGLARLSLSNQLLESVSVVVRKRLDLRRSSGVA